MTEYLPTLSIDFDGVINPYTNGFGDGSVYDPFPMIGTMESLRLLSEKYRLVVSTARDELDVVRQALTDWGLDEFFDDVTNTKPPAQRYIDDRGLQFFSWPQVLEELEVGP